MLIGVVCWSVALSTPYSLREINSCPLYYILLCYVLPTLYSKHPIIPHPPPHFSVDDTLPENDWLVHNMRYTPPQHPGFTDYIDAFKWAMIILVGQGIPNAGTQLESVYLSFVMFASLLLNAHLIGSL